MSEVLLSEATMDDLYEMMKERFGTFVFYGDNHDPNIGGEGDIVSAVGGAAGPDAFPSLRDGRSGWGSVSTGPRVFRPPPPTRTAVPAPGIPGRTPGTGPRRRE